MSQGLGFTAPAMKGHFPGIERLAAHYPPVYPFLIGLWFWIFGFSITSSLLFSLLICGISAALLVCLFECALGAVLPRVVYGLVFIAWILSVSAIHRPDPLYVLFGLLLLWAFQKWLPQRSRNWSTYPMLALLMGLSLGTSPVIGIFMLPYFCSVFITTLGPKRESFLLFLGLSLGGIIVSLSLWALVFRTEPLLFRYQFLDRALLIARESETLNAAFLRIRFLIGHDQLFWHLPLLLFLFTITPFSLLRAPRTQEKQALFLSFVTLMGIWCVLWWKVQNRYTYLNMSHVFLLYVCGVAFVRGLIEIKNSLLRQLLHGVVWLGIFVAVLSFVRMALMPLTWSGDDLYAYNGRRILGQIPKGSVVLTDVRFWYLLEPRYRIYDAHFSHSSIYESDYVLLASGGSGRPDAVLTSSMTAAEYRYFTQNFKRKDSTLSKAPNRLLGLLIARSRWSYRFDLYERKERRPI